MTAPSTRDTHVLIVGAGPTGLVLALWLTRLGVRVRIIDKTSGPGTTSRALAVQARTLELYRQIRLADAVVAGAPGDGDRFPGRHIQSSLLRRRRRSGRRGNERRAARRARHERLSCRLSVEGGRARAAHRHRACGRRTSA